MTEETKNERFYLWLTPREKKQWKQKAKKLGISVAGLIRMSVARFIKEEEQE